MTQIDLPHNQKSGLKEALEILSGIDDIAVINLTQKDIVRHKLVTSIVNAYQAYDKKKLYEHDDDQKSDPNTHTSRHISEHNGENDSK